MLHSILCAERRQKEKEKDTVEDVKGPHSHGGEMPATLELENHQPDFYLYTMECEC